MYIERVSEATEALQEALRRLVPQLGAHKKSPVLNEVNELLRSEASSLLIARYPEQSDPIAGLLCLIVYRVPTGIRAVIEDVVVDESMRRHGIGKALIQEAIKMARAAGADGVSLTSNPRRENANQLYKSMGFELRQTNPYLYRLR